MTLLQLQYFCAVAHYMNYNQAARALHVSQPTLSKAVSSLEQELGFYLFERSGKYIELTRYGLLYYQKIAPALTAISEATEEVQRMTDEKSGHISLAFNPPFAQGYVPNLVSRFLSQASNSQVSIQFNQASSTVMTEGILDGTYDVGFATMLPNNPKITYIPLRSEKLVIIAPPDHRLTLYSSIRLADLQSYSFINYTSECGLRPIVDGYLKDAMGSIPASHYTAPDERSIASLVESGHGIALVADVPSLDFFRIKKIALKEPVCERIIYLVHDANRYLTPVVQRFISFVRHQKDL